MKFHEQKNEYFEILSEKLVQQYGINFNDTGYSKSEWLAYFEDLTIDEAITVFALKYDLSAAGDLILLSKKYF